MKRFIIFALLPAVLFINGCAPASDFDARLNPLVTPYRFSIAGWEWQTIIEQAKDWYSGRKIQVDDETRVVIEYFDTVKRIKTLQSEIEEAVIKSGGSAPFQLEYELRNLQEKQALQAPIVEKVIKKQIRETLAEQDIFNPVGKGKAGFPPLNFKLEEMPALLVISSREKIESLREIVLEQDMTLKEKEALEAKVDESGVSSLVVNLGGMATYPSLIDSGAGLSSAIETAAHEWLHQYLAFTPLGFRYVLDLTGISPNYDIATMNESLAGMVGKEIGAVVYRKYYPAYESETTPKAGNSFDFNLAMREIRKMVDTNLARGEIKQAEDFMEQQRKVLASNGYYIRKLNQAYFAFHGAYADSPAFQNPIGLELKELRAKSASLKDFLAKAAGMTSRRDLAESVR